MNESSRSVLCYVNHVWLDFNYQLSIKNNGSFDALRLLRMTEKTLTLPCHSEEHSDEESVYNSINWNLAASGR